MKAKVEKIVWDNAILFENDVFLKKRIPAHTTIDEKEKTGDKIHRKMTLKIILDFAGHKNKRLATIEYPEDKICYNWKKVGEMMVLNGYIEPAAVKEMLQKLIPEIETNFEYEGTGIIGQSESGMAQCWHFWNYNFLARQYLTRPTKKHKNRPNIVNLPYKCSRCKETFRGKRYKTGMVDSGAVYICPKCYDILTRQVLEDARTDEARKSIEKAKEFEELLADCRTKGTCDILAAHHEALKDDPNRLRTDFLVSLICGTEKKQSSIRKQRSQRGLQP